MTNPAPRTTSVSPGLDTVWGFAFGVDVDEDEDELLERFNPVEAPVLLLALPLATEV